MFEEGTRCPFFYAHMERFDVWIQEPRHMNQDIRIKILDFREKMKE